MAYDHFTYFEKIAKAIPEIGAKKFLKASTPRELEGLLNSNSGLSKFILVACCEDESKLLDAENEAVFQDNKFEFMILHPTTQDNHKTIFTAFESCKNICNRIISRLFYDSKNGRDIPIQALLPNQIQFDNVGPIASTWYGVIVAFTLREPYYYKYNPKDWNE